MSPSVPRRASLTTHSHRKSEDTRAVTLPDIGVPHYIGVPHRVTYPQKVRHTPMEKLIIKVTWMSLPEVHSVMQTLAPKVN